MPGDELRRGRAAFDARSWHDAYDSLAAADAASPLDPEDLELLATAAYLTARYVPCTDLWGRAYRGFVERGDDERAAGAAFWMAFTLLNRGEGELAAGWVGRGIELLDADGGRNCVQRGFLLGMVGIQALMQGDPERALPIMLEVRDIADRFADADLTVLSRLGHGQTLLALGRTAEGMALLDGILVAVTSGEASAPIAGLACCAVIIVCRDSYDVRRAQQWTTALTHMCDTQPDLLPYSGQCLVHRAEIMQLRGSWPDASETARDAVQRFELAAEELRAGAAYYVAAEISRLQGDLEAAEQGYLEASRRGHDPQPGVALLRLAQGRTDAAASTSRRLVAEPSDRVRRPRVLTAHVEVMLAAGDVPAARAAADELTEVAGALDAPLLAATAAGCAGAVQLAEGDAAGALARLRQAWTAWQHLDAPYEAARTRVVMALACRALGDEDSAQMELDAARWAFHRLGAAGDLSRVDALASPAAPAPTDGLTAREVEVLRLVATGRTNRAIAAELVLSEKTVQRHVSNIFAKAGLASRAAATAYAYEHDLL